MKGYTPQFRALGTPEGDFHAAFTTANAKTRKCVRELAKAHPTDGAGTKLVAALTEDRRALWSKWKSALPTHLQPIVLSVKKAHHGPSLSEGDSAPFTEFLSLLESVNLRTRRRLDDLVAAMPGDPATEDCSAEIRRNLDTLDAALVRLRRTSSM